MTTRNAIARSDLEYHRREEDGESVVYVRDPIRNVYFKYSLVQATLLRALDGRSYGEIAEDVSEQFEIEIPPQVAEHFVATARDRLLLDITSYRETPAKARKLIYRALRRRGFHFGGRRAASGPGPFMAAVRELEGGDPLTAARHLADAIEHDPNDEQARTLVAIIQDAYVKASGTAIDHPTWTLFDPTTLLRRLDKVLGRLAFSSLGVAFLLILVVVGTYSIVSTGMFGIADMSFTKLDIAIAIVMVLLQGAVHELGHGYVCSHYGGDVREVGIMLMYSVQPAFYCDTSSTYLFKNARHKVMVQLAGPVASIACSAFLAFVLTVLSPTVAIYPGVALSLVIGLGMQILNFVPFLKFDGYYAVCDLVGVTNLRERSMKYFFAASGRRLLGIDLGDAPPSRRQRTGFFLFALMSILFTAWMILVWYLRLITWMVEHWQLTGLVLALVLTYFLQLRRVLRSVGRAAWLIVRERRRIFTPLGTLRVAGVVAVLVGPWVFIRRPVHFDAEFTLVPTRRAEVRARVAGLLDEVFVSEGEQVKAGQPVARIRNVELGARVTAAIHDLERADVRVAELRAGARPEEIELARTRVALAAAARSEVDERLLVANTLASAGLATASQAAAIEWSAVSTSSRANVASAHLRLVDAGHRVEEITEAEAERARILADLDGLRSETDLLLLRSPIDGIVATEHLSDKLQMHVGAGDAVLAVHDTSELVAEVAVPTWMPMQEIDAGGPVTLRPYGMPSVKVNARFDHLRDKTGGDVREGSGARVGELVLLTSRFALDDGRSGMTGKARIYGKTRSLGYELFYLPVQRLMSIRLFSL